MAADVVKEYRTQVVEDSLTLGILVCVVSSDSGCSEQKEHLSDSCICFEDAP